MQASRRESRTSTKEPARRKQRNGDGRKLTDSGWIFNAVLWTAPAEFLTMPLNWPQPAEVCFLPWSPVSNAPRAENGTPLPSMSPPDDGRATWKTARSAASRTCCASSTTTRRRNSSSPPSWNERDGNSVKVQFEKRAVSGHRFSDAAKEPQF